MNMGNLVSSCTPDGIAEFLIGDKDWTMSNKGIHHSNARRDRDRDRLTNEIRQQVVQRESSVQRLSMELQTLQNEARGYHEVLRRTNVAPRQKLLAKQKAQRVLQAVAHKQRELQQAQSIVSMARQRLDQIDQVQRGNDDRTLFANINNLTKKLELGTMPGEELAKQGEQLLEDDETFAEHANALESTVSAFDSALQANAANAGLEFDLSDDAQLMAALGEFTENGSYVAADVTESTAWAGATAGPTAHSTSDSEILLASAPAALNTPFYNGGSGGGGNKPNSSSSALMVPRHNATANKFQEVFF